MDISRLSVSGLGHLYRSGALSPVMVTEHLLGRIDAEDAKLHSFNTVTSELALEAAERAGDDLKAGRDRGPLQGIPFGVKDVIDTAGVLTSCQSRLLADNIPASDATVVRRLKEGGAVLLGKTATFEFATGGPATDALFPPALNPWDLERMPGGSSSGSAAAIAAGFTRIALGTDTGGSIRGPAALCGVVGIKPTYGLVSRQGVFPLAYSMDHAGLLAASVEDAAIVLECIAGYDAADVSSADVPAPNLRERMSQGIEGLKVGLLKSWYGDGSANPEMAAAIEEAAATLERLGARVEEAELPHWRTFLPIGRLVLFSEAHAVHQKDLVERPDLYGWRTRGRVSSGAFIGVADYINAQRLRRKLIDEACAGAFARYDVLLAPSTLAPAGRFDELADDPTAIADVTTVPFNLTGHPALTVRAGFSRSGLPLAVQIVGRHFREDVVFSVGAAYEQATDWNERRPPLFAGPEAARPFEGAQA